MPKNPASPFVALTVIMSIGVAVFFTLYSLIPLTYKDDPRLSSIFMGVMMTFVMGVQAFTPIFVRRFSLQTVLVVSPIFLAVGAFIVAIAKMHALVIVGVVMGGAGFGVLVVAGAQGVALVVPSEKLSRAIGTYGLVSMTATSLGSPLGVQLALTFSTLAFGIIALFAGGLGVWMALAIPAGLGKGSVHSDPDTTRASLLNRIKNVIQQAPLMILALLLVSVVLLSHGLSTLPVIGSSFGNAALIVFATQAGNAVGRSLGGEIQTRLGSGTAAIFGASSVSLGGTLWLFGENTALFIASGVLVGLGIGVVQTVTLHSTMQKMTPGSASVVWNLSVDAGLWTGGVLWGLALTTGTVTYGAVLFSALAIAAGIVVAFQVGLNPKK